MMKILLRIFDIDEIYTNDYRLGLKNSLVKKGSFFAWNFNIYLYNKPYF
jgi:hypothetical protein